MAPLPRPVAFIGSRWPEIGGIPIFSSAHPLLTMTYSIETETVETLKVGQMHFLLYMATELCGSGNRMWPFE